MAEKTGRPQSTFGWKQVLKWLKEYMESDSKFDAMSLQRVFRVDPDITCDDNWDGRLLVLCNDRSISEIIRILYQEELAKGAALTDIGIWKSLFHRSVIQDISALSQKGYLRVENVREADTVVAVKCNDPVPATDAAQLDERLVSIEV